jgi:hypothetical protein
MNVFLIFVNDENFNRLAAREGTGGSKNRTTAGQGDGIPPLVSETLASVLPGTDGKSLDVRHLHPQMKECRTSPSLR